MYQWKKIDFHPPYRSRPIYYHASHTSHVVGNCVSWIFISWRGIYSGLTNAIYIYNIKELTAWDKNHNTDPSPRTSHASVCIGKSVYLFGGDSYSLSNDLWCYDFEGGGSPRCIQAEGEIPMPRRYHVMTHHGGCLYVFGGEISQGATRGQGSVHDFHRYDIVKNTWKEIHSKESPLTRYDSTIETVKNMLWLFGGTSPRNIFNDLWRFNVNCMEWDQICYSNGAFPRTRARMTSCVIDSSIYYFGGYRDDRELCNELWEFQTETYTWRLLNIPNHHGCVPIPRYRHSMCVSNENEIFVTGGYDNCLNWTGKQNLNDFWAISPHVKVQYIQVEVMKTGWNFTNVLFKWDE
jgi:N-acetylneuraminic acid mutarotase